MVGSSLSAVPDHLVTDGRWRRATVNWPHKHRSRLDRVLFKRNTVRSPNVCSRRPTRIKLEKELCNSQGPAVECLPSELEKVSWRQGDNQSTSRSTSAASSLPDQRRGSWTQEMASLTQAREQLQRLAAMEEERDEAVRDTWLWDTRCFFLDTKCFFRDTKICS